MTPGRGVYPNRQTMEWLESASFKTQEPPSIPLLYSAIDMLTQQRDEARSLAQQWRFTAYLTAGMLGVLVLLLGILLLVR